MSNKNYKNKNYLTKSEFLKLYEKRLQEKGIEKSLSKIVSGKVTNFLLKNIFFYVLSGYAVKIHKLGTFQVEEFSGKRYNVVKRATEKYKEERMTLRVPSTLRLAIRGNNEQD